MVDDSGTDDLEIIDNVVWFHAIPIYARCTCEFHEFHDCYCGTIVVPYKYAPKDS